MPPPPKPTSPATSATWLRARFSLESPREAQPEVLTALLSGRRILFVAPTGHGKSLTYQALAASPWSRGIVLVFQPLKALMQEQVERAHAMGLRAALINSDLDPDAQTSALDRAARGELDILFLAPERQGNALWIERVGQLEIKGIVIDEAHCISQWGHDFRPWYCRLVDTVMGIGVRTPVLALTATAPRVVVNDVRGQISPDDEPVEVIRLPSYRANLRLAAVVVDGLTTRLAATLRIARRIADGAGIVYLLTHDETEIAAGFLTANGVPAQPYHGGLSAEVRASTLKAWHDGTARVVCATSALGMGIDRADVRFIAHAGMPDSLLRYVQEIGRAGRDGQPALVVAIHDRETIPIYEALARSSLPSVEDHLAIANHLRENAGTRTEIIRATDVPQPTTQHILDDFVGRALCQRTGTPFVYTWCGGASDGLPDRLAETIEHRRRLTREALAYATEPTCRAAALARAMGDDDTDFACDMCDRCKPRTRPPFDSEAALARDFLAQYMPIIRAVKWRHEEGQSLSRYRLGPIGEAVHAAKYKGVPLPADVVQRAISTVRDPDGPFAGVAFGALVSIPSTTSTLVRDFAKALAAGLGLPWSELVKSRRTEKQKQFRSREMKEANIKDAFTPIAFPADTNVLLVDDILDSGESLRAAAKALHPARSFPLVLARAKHQDDQ